MPQQTKVDTSTLCAIFQAELVLIKEMVQISLAQEKSVVTGDITLLQALINKLKECHLKGRMLELERVKISRKLAQSFRLQPTCNLMTLINSLPVEQRQPVLQLRLQLLEAERELKQSEERNKVFLDAAICCTQFHINTLTSAALHSPAYGSNLTRIANPAFYLDNKV